MSWIWWCLVAYSAATFVGSFECPKGDGCSDCRFGYEEEVYTVNCATTSIGVVQVQILPESYIRLSCRNLANWAKFHLGSEHPVRGVKSLSFDSCNLPEANRLGSLTKQLLVDEIESLEFRSVNNLRWGITADTFRGLSTLEELALTAFDLSIIPENLFEHLPRLKMLNLQNSNLHYLPNKLFASSNGLEAIELSSNQLTQVNSTAFENLPHLRLLNLWNNKINDIAESTFDKLVALEAIGLQRNMLATLPRGIFSRARNLKTINLSQNNFTSDSLPADLLTNCDNLRILVLMDNRRNMTTLPERFCADLTNLSIVKLRKIGLTKLSGDIFHGATNLRTVSLERNYLLTLPVDIFRDNHQILNLDLSFNEIAFLPDRIFSNLRNTIKLDLSRNHIEAISENLFTGLTSLRELNMARNKMIEIHDQAFVSLVNLRIAEFSFNALALRSSETTIHSPFHYAEKLEELHLDHNNVSNIFADWMFSMNSMRVLNLAYNNLQYLMHEDLQFLSENLYVDLTNNNISHVYLDGVESWAAERTYSRNLIISIEKNPIECDCELYSLLRYLEGRLNSNVKKAFILEIGHTKCEAPNELKGTIIMNLRSKTFKCETNQISKLKNSCPDQCGCYVRPENKACLVNCVNEGFIETLKKVECPVDHSIELNFSGNSLSSMPNVNWPGYERISVLDLDHNNISSISIEMLPPNLKVLKLSNNALARLDGAVIDYLENSTQLTRLSLDSNPWKCDCDARRFLNFIQKKSLEIPELMKITCSGRESLPIHQMTPDELCPTNNMWIIIGCSLIALLGLILGTLAAVYYRYQMEIKVWLYAKNLCLWFVTENELDRDKLFDAFISYSHKDEDFVVNDLIPKLEAEPRPFKLCVHFRDWLAGEWIPKQIARSVEESRRTIVVLSPNFLESVWGRMEFRAAHSQALSEGRARVIVILYGDIGPTEELDPELNAYLSMNTYVKWGDPWFWQKLKYAMPHSSEFTTMKQSRRHNLFFQTMQPLRIERSNDKSDLIEASSLVPTKSINMHDDLSCNKSQK
ncbi:protein toll-like [Venturia canescens]|uniref:protein toll-like n=1 Tax=Venturia canescens TaxID=32260 RepID=UPI001C9D230B|nr:protein toll-like [Venturia canescens]